MPDWFTNAAVIPDLSPLTFQVAFFDHDPTEARWSPTEAGKLTIRLLGDEHPNAGAAREITLRVEEGMTASQLQRFPWGRWLTAADAYARAKVKSADPDWAIKTKAAFAASQGKRPGRRGHDADFLPAICRRYEELRIDGVRSPVQTIANEHQVSRNTAAGWVKQAREKGLLPKARRPGKAG